MCGIACIFDYNRITDDDIAVVKRMNRIQEHRGPDDEGMFWDESCVLGHRRLSIIDLSRDGHEPFASDDGRYLLIYNGETYNYIELREELKSLGWTFRTRTDKEVLLKAYLQYGEGCLTKLNGIFAFVVYDTVKKEVFLARDHVGIKPLYYTTFGSKIYFASEIKALRGIPGLPLSVNNQAVFDFLVFNRTDVFDETFHNEIHRIPKGHYGILTREGLTLTQWWNPEVFLQDPSINGEMNQQIPDKIEELLVSAVQLQMRSDVTVGSCLSGGLDSSILTGIIYDHNHTAEQFNTFTSSFPGHPIDETRYVDSLNKKYPFQNFRTFPTAQTAYDNFSKFVYTIDEPTADSSFYSQYEVMRLAKDHGVTVLLDGQGGDENFAGYQYFHGFYLYGLLNSRRIPAFTGEMIKVLLRRQDRSAYQTFLFQVLPHSIRKRLLFQNTPSISPEFFDAYVDSSLVYTDFFNAPDLHTSLVRHFQYKLEHLLRLEDRNSMAFSIEARVPYLDYRLVEYVLTVSDDLKIHAGVTKHLQKLALGHYTIPDILNRTDKIGFGTPMDEWMSTAQWTGFTDENYRYLTETFPDIIVKTKQLPSAGNQRWKLNQLAAWHQMVGN